MSRILLTCNIESSFSLYNLTIHTSFFKRSYHFHRNQIIAFKEFASFLLLIWSLGRYIISIDNSTLLHIILIYLNLDPITFNNSNMGLFHLPRLIANNLHISIFKLHSVFSSRQLFKNFSISL